MLVRIFTLRFDPVLGGFDDQPLRDFVRDKEVLSVRDHFFVKDETPCLAVVVTYNLVRPEVEAPRIAAREERPERQEPWRQLLEETDWPLFNTLRDWRNAQAREEGITAYVICTNRQLAAIAHERPESLAKLGVVEGLGRAKLERYGGSILALVAPAAAEPQSGSTADGADHARLQALLARRVKDRRLLELLDRIIAPPVPGNAPGKGSAHRQPDQPAPGQLLSGPPGPLPQG